MPWSECARTTRPASVLSRAVRAMGHEPAVVATAAEALRAFPRPGPTVVLDIGLPDADGRDLCLALRANGVRSPVLFLTARDGLARQDRRLRGRR